MMADRVMLCTAFGPGRGWCLPLLKALLYRLGGLHAVAVAWDGVEPQRLSSPVPVTSLTLPVWNGGPDPRRYGRLARMRIALRDVFLSSDCDWLYWHDCDTLPPRDIIPELLALSAPVTTGCYPLRNLPYAMQPILHCADHTSLLEVQACEGYGMGCMLVHRDVLDRTPFRSPEYWRDVDPEGLGEDWQWGLDSGVVHLVDTRLSCWHCGEERAARIVFGDVDYVVVWMGPGEVTNEFGVWKHASIRADLTAEQAAALPVGFARGPARQMWLETAATADLLAEMEGGC